jgi:hypothetical protein
MALEYTQKGKRDTGRPKTRWSEKEHFKNLHRTGIRYPTPAYVNYYYYHHHHHHHHHQWR